jgi:pullulanase
MIIYGEGWTAGDSPLPVDQRALKKNIIAMPKLIAFSDDLRDGLKGSVFENESTGFVNGGVDKEESVKFGIVGAIDHPQIDYKKINYSDAPWTSDPWQAIAYVSCHDNHTIYDKLKVSVPDASEEKIIAMDKLATAVVLTSQGTAFLHAGSEMLRTKNGEHNSYNLPDSINQIDWSRKVTHAELFGYYKNLITLRKNHPAFRMKSGDAVRQHLEFKVTESGLIAYELKNHANGDPWKNILVIYNAREQSVDFQLTGTWQLVVKGNDFDFDGITLQKGNVVIPPISMMILFQK